MLAFSKNLVTPSHRQRRFPKRSSRDELGRLDFCPPCGKPFSISRLRSLLSQVPAGTATLAKLKGAIARQGLVVDRVGGADAKPMGGPPTDFAGPLWSKEVNTSILSQLIL